MFYLVDTTYDGIVDGLAVYVAEPGSSTPFALFVDGWPVDLIDPPSFNCSASDTPQEVGTLGHEDRHLG